MKQDEQDLLRAMQTECGAYNLKGGRRAHEIAHALGINWKRACYLFGKWGERGWYSYGTASDSGWLTPKGMTIEPK